MTRRRRVPQISTAAELEHLNETRWELTEAGREALAEARELERAQRANSR